MAKRRNENGQINKEEYDLSESNIASEEAPRGMALAPEEILKKRRMWKSPKKTASVGTNTKVSKPPSTSFSMSEPISKFPSTPSLGTNSHNPFAAISFATPASVKKIESSVPPVSSSQNVKINSGKIDKFKLVERLLYNICVETERCSKYPHWVSIVNIENISNYNLLKVKVEEEEEKKEQEITEKNAILDSHNGRTLPFPLSTPLSKKSAMSSSMQLLGNAVTSSEMSVQPSNEKNSTTTNILPSKPSTKVQPNHNKDEITDPDPDRILEDRTNTEERCLYEIRAKKLVLLDKEWADRGTGLAKLYQHTKYPEKSHLVMRDDVGKVILNVAISTDFKYTKQKIGRNFTGIRFIAVLKEGDKPTMTMLKVKNEFHMQFCNLLDEMNK